MASVEAIKEMVKEYVDSRIELTLCMQRHFRQVCSKCKKYDRCLVYGRWVSAWVVLQRIPHIE